MGNDGNKGYSNLDIFSIVLILISIGLFVFESKQEQVFLENEALFNALDYLIITGFAVDFLIRALNKSNGKKYLFSFDGLIDFIAFAPSLVGLLFGLNLNSAWWRALRLFRLVKIKSIPKYIDARLGVFTYLIPYLVATIAFKAVIIAFETESWWPEIGNINTVLGVTGFAVAIAMGTKLSVVNSRIYAIEDAICRVIGAVRDVENLGNIKPNIVQWTLKLEQTLKLPSSEKPTAAAFMRLQTDELERAFESNNIGGPATAGFHRDVAFLLHRITAFTPPAFDNFLRIITIIYSLVLILTVPGVVGLFSSILIVLSLGGVYFINKDMDNPLDYSEGSLFDVRLDALEQYNQIRVTAEGNVDEEEILNKVSVQAS